MYKKQPHLSALGEIANKDLSSNSFFINRTLEFNNLFDFFHNFLKKIIMELEITYGRAV